ncbi:oxidoreductase [Lysinibacillus sphaericus]|uniref:oxidoreductase n=1 Tax=Lysinibacillus sphaericus TaxID=1421 RepID=UPI0018CFA5EB|nr:oxidoreductase [Lysinibacillus sphaericus]MBG9452566.1 oxidoreductase [Lysinibacillus sphaericus]MBG9477271.1 oxidoreductase [Lysinibacillus sphaericus]MBG9592777.1 oxidoreductase [Lysinibacillus sphaericus]
MGMRAAIVVGATGLTGTSLVEQLCENDEYVSVTVIARRAPAFTHPKLEVKIRNLDTLEEKDLEFANELYCCLGTTIKKAGSREQFEKVDFEYPLTIASLAKKRGIPHMLIITAMGANEKSPFYYNRVKGKLEHDLMELGLQRLSIIRPSLLVGEREEFRLGEKAGEKFLKLAKPLLVGPLKRSRAIEASQVAKAMIVIALYGDKQPVTIYPSQELAQLDFPETQHEDASRENLFNWEKRKLSSTSDEGDKVNQEVVINRDKYKIEETVVDKEVNFQHRRDK